jgi:Cu/Ag efflux protein CusF
MSHVMSRSLAATVAILAIAATSVLAQTPSTPPPGPATAPAPSAPPATRPMPDARAPQPSEVEGKVSKVDSATQTVRVSSGFLGMFGRTLEVTGNTDIQMDGRQASLADIREGARVKAAYEQRNGKNVATRIEVMREAERARQ